MQNKLFAVYLGGRAPKCNTELHDVVFVVGETVEATYAQLMDKWFGTVEDLHLDSWMELDIIDGYQITVSDQSASGDQKLFFVNLGAYADGQFTELHANVFLVAGNKVQAKSRAKSALLTNSKQVHTDDLHEVDDCIELNEFAPYHIVLEKTAAKKELRPVNGYHIIPEHIVEAYLVSRR